MRLLLVALLLLPLTACVEVKPVAHRTQRLPPGSAITLDLLTLDAVGLEHAVFQTLLEAGFDVRSRGGNPFTVKPAASPNEGEVYLRYATPYACRLKVRGAADWGGAADWISSFQLQIIDVPSGRILLSLAGEDRRDGSWYTVRMISEALKSQLAAPSTL